MARLVERSRTVVLGGGRGGLAGPREASNLPGARHASKEAAVGHGEAPSRGLAPFETSWELTQHVGGRRGGDCTHSEEGDAAVEGKRGAEGGVHLGRWVSLFFFVVGPGDLKKTPTPGSREVVP